MNRDIGYLIRAVSNLLRRRVLELQAKATPELTDMHRQILGYLYAHQDQELYQRDLEAAFSVRRSTISRFLAALEQLGMLDRVAVPQDARLKKLVLTPKAIALHQQVERHIRTVEEMLVEGMSPEEVEQLRSLLVRVKDNLL